MDAVAVVEFGDAGAQRFADLLVQVCGTVARQSQDLPCGAQRGNQLDRLLDVVSDQDRDVAASQGDALEAGGEFLKNVREGQGKRRGLT